jgi:CRP-like cAMP-binding protein
MYFIVKGQVNCISSEGIHLSQIGMGKIFGAEILQKGSVRTSTIQAATDVSVAVMTTEDFLKICELYPSFKKRILQIVINRDQENKE